MKSLTISTSFRVSSQTHISSLMPMALTLIDAGLPHNQKKILAFVQAWENLPTM